MTVSTVSGFSPTDADTLGRTTSNAYTVTGLQNGTRYYFRVKAVNSSNQSGVYSQEISITPVFDGPIWYVAQDGSNTNEGSESSPFATLSEAVNYAKDGHTIKLKPGTYRGEDSRIFLSGKNLNIEGESTESTIIDGENNDRILHLQNGTYRI